MSFVNPRAETVRAPVNNAAAAQQGDLGDNNDGGVAILGVPDLTRVFDNRLEAVNFIKDWAPGHGFTVSLAKSSSQDRARFKCRYGGTYVPKSTGKRPNASGVQNGCPFEMYAVKRRDGLFHLGMTNAYHNHGPTPQDQMGRNPQARARDLLPQLPFVRRLLQNDMRPSDALKQLHGTDSESLALRRDIYNVRNQMRQEELEGRTSMSALIDTLDEDGIRYKVGVDESNHTSRLFFMFPDSLKMLHLSPKVLVIDATYKTNRFRMPLVHAVGITSTYKTFDAFYCFTRNETTTDYEWILDAALEIFENLQIEVIVTDCDRALMAAIRTCFPLAKNLLCTWHINQNIVAKQRSAFQDKPEMESFMVYWNDVIYAPTEASFEAKWDYMENIAKGRLSEEKAERVIGYLRNQWYPLRFQWAYAWTSKFRHLGQQTTQRVEGGHATMKKSIETSTGDLKTTYQAIKGFHRTRIREILAGIGSQQDKKLGRLTHPIYAHVKGRISNYALIQVDDTLKLVIQAIEQPRAQIQLPCTGAHEAIWGIPCSHKLRQHVEAVVPLSLDDFDPHWILRHPSAVDIIPPAIVAQGHFTEEQILDWLRYMQNQTPHEQEGFHQALGRLVEATTNGRHAADAVLVQEPTMAVARIRQNNRLNAEERRQLLHDESTRRELTGAEHAQIAAGDIPVPTDRPSGRAPVCTHCRGRHRSAICANVAPAPAPRATRSQSRIL